MNEQEGGLSSETLSTGEDLQVLEPPLKTPQLQEEERNLYHDIQAQRTTNYDESRYLQKVHLAQPGIQHRLEELNRLGDFFHDRLCLKDGSKAAKVVTNVNAEIERWKKASTRSAIKNLVRGLPQLLGLRGVAIPRYETEEKDLKKALELSDQGIPPEKIKVLLEEEHKSRLDIEAKKIGTSREWFLNIFSRRPEIQERRLAAFGLKLLELGRRFNKRTSAEQTSWEAYVHRMSSQTSFHATTLDRETSMDTRNMYYDDEGKLAAWGLGANALTIKMNVTEKDPAQVDRSVIFHHQINGDPAREFANELKLETKQSQESDSASIAKIAATIHATAKLLEDHQFGTRPNHETQEPQHSKSVNLRGVDFYSTEGYAHYIEEVDSEQISLCINGHEYLYAIREKGQLKDVRRIKADVRAIIFHANRAGTPSLDVRGATASEKTMAAAKDIVKEMGEKRYTQLASAQFRVAIDIENLQSFSTGEKEALSLEKAGAEMLISEKQLERISAGKAKLEAFGAELTFKFRRWKARRLQRRLNEALTDESTQGEQISAIDLTDKLTKLKEKVRKTLISAYANTDYPDAVVDATIEKMTKKLSGDAATVEMLYYLTPIIGISGEPEYGHPVNCVMEQRDLAIANSFYKRDEKLKDLRKQVKIGEETYSSKYQSTLSAGDQEGAKQAQMETETARKIRMGFIQGLTQIEKRKLEAERGDGVNASLIRATVATGQLFADMPRPLRQITKWVFLATAKLPQYKGGGKQFIRDAWKINVWDSPEKVRAEVEMLLTEMMNYEGLPGLSNDITGNITVSAPMVKGNVGVTCASKRGTGMVMINKVKGENDETRRVLTFRGRHARQLQDEFVRKLDLISKAFDENIIYQ